MKLTSLTIHNMFSYYGTSIIDFDGITCIIGTNGLGKTSILNAIKLCLGSSKIDIESVLNNNADESQCFVTIDFDEFSITRKWSFSPKLEESLIVTHKDESKVEDAEAEHFLHNKIPDFLVDFLFYDGEVGDNLLLLSNTRLKSIFDFVFDLDLLENTRKDSLEVSKKLLEYNSSEETKDLIALEKEKDSLQSKLSKLKESIESKQKEYKAQNLELQKTNTQIRNKSKKTKELHKQLDDIQEELDTLAQQFKEIIVWQMPLLLNQNLLKKMKNKSSQAISIEDEALFSNQFKKFANEIQTPLEVEQLLQLFQSLMLNRNNKIKLSTNRTEFKKLIHRMKDLKLLEKQTLEKIKEIETSLMEQEVVKKLIETRDIYEKQLTILDEEITNLDASISEVSIQIKEIDKSLTHTLKANQNKYASLQGYKELKAIAYASEKVYKTRLKTNLNVFNEKLKNNTINFLRQYEHIQDIHIDQSHRIIITDGEQKLNTKLLSAGQKQVLNFLIVKTILEFKKFASFVMVDTPFGRLSNKNKDLLLNTCYLEFDSLILLLTDSEYEFIKTQNLNYKHYEIQRTLVGSKVEELT